MAWSALAAVALAEVRVNDPSACVDREAVDLEVRDLLGDAAVDGLDLFVGVAADLTSRAVALRVSDVRGDLLWEKRLAAQEGDCPLLPEIVARSIEAGLAQVPGWRFRAERGRSRPEGMVWGRLSAPSVLRVGLGGALQGHAFGPGWWSVGIDGFASPFAPLGSGVVQIGGIGVAAGPALRIRAGRESVDVAVRGWAGGIGVFGRSFDLERTALLPRASVDPEILLVTRAAIRVGARGEIPLTRIALTGPGQEVPAYEPAFRIGLVVALGGVLGSGEGGGTDRP